MALVLVLSSLIACATGTAPINAPDNSPQSSAEIPASTELTAPTTSAVSQETAPNQIMEGQELKVHFIDVGQGDAILIDLKDFEVLIDGGDRSPGVVPYLIKYVDGPLEAMIATHPHADHIGGLIDVLAAFQVEQIWHNGETATSKTYTDFMSAVSAEKTQVFQAIRGNTINVEGLDFKVLSPSDLKGTTNNNSIVLLFTYGVTDFLFMGDAEKEAEAGMLVKSDIQIPHVEVLKVGHHGSNTASSADFLAITTPETAIYMAGTGNVYGHPHQGTIQALTNVGAKICGTDVYGTITITTDGQSYEMQTDKQRSSDTANTQTSTTTAPMATAPPNSSSTPEAPKESNIQITSIFYDGKVARTESDEYVEITNMGSDTVDLAGWILKDISGSPSFTFPSYILQPGKEIRVYTNENHPEYGGFSFSSGTAVWNNSNPDTAGLYNSEGKEVSRKSY
ncbi:lamin tail domain-containing protein [Chloroflexota bacterium]